jgi:hypothetical protein
MYALKISLRLLCCSLLRHRFKGVLERSSGKDITRSILEPIDDASDGDGEDSGRGRSFSRDKYEQFAIT